jgi:hypothetical protein
MCIINIPYLPFFLAIGHNIIIYNLHSLQCYIPFSRLLIILYLFSLKVLTFRNILQLIMHLDNAKQF